MLASGVTSHQLLAKFSYTFAKAGEYAYLSSFHIVEHMVGNVIVK